MTRPTPSTARYAVDLHSHTTHSDGSLTPAELVALAAGRGVRWLAITDHDTVSSLGPATEAARALGLQLVPGVEISATWRNELHVLGYGIDVLHPALVDLLGGQSMNREARFDEILRLLAKLGIRLDGAAIRATADGNLGRPHIAHALVQAGHSPGFQRAFDLFLGAGAPAYVPASKITVEQAVTAIHDAGGVAVLAHPGPDDLVRHVPALAELGFDGVECLHPSQPLGITLQLQALCKRLDLVPTGGSDFHTPRGKAQPGDFGIDAYGLQRLLGRAA